jgi:hypothetical protein
MLAIALETARSVTPNSVAVLSTPAGSRAKTPTPFRDGAPTLLMDGSFETDSDGDGVADNWVRVAGGGSFGLEGNGAYGTSAQRISVTGVSDPERIFSAVQQRVSVTTSGATYELSVDYRYSNAASRDSVRSVGIVVYALDSAGEFINSGTSIDWGWETREVWTRKAMTFVIPPSANTVIVEFRISVNGSFWIDGALLREQR